MHMKISIQHRFWLAVLLLLSISVLVVSGIRLHILSEQVNPDLHIVHLWQEINEFISLVSQVLVTIHLLIHLKWFQTVLSFKKVKQLLPVALSVAAFIALIVTGSMLEDKAKDGALLLPKLHFGIGLLMALLSVIHLVPRLKWIRSTVASLSQKNNSAGAYRTMCEKDRRH